MKRRLWIFYIKLNMQKNLFLFDSSRLIKRACIEVMWHMAYYTFLAYTIKHCG